VAVAAKKVVDTATAKEAAAVKTEEGAAVKAIEEASTKTTAEEAAMAKAFEEAVGKTVADEAAAAKVATEAAAVEGPDGSGGGGPNVVRSDARGAPDTTSDSKVVGKRSAATTGLGGSSPPRKCFRSSRWYATHLLHFSFSLFTQVF
jgi:hypothetical protein